MNDLHLCTSCSLYDDNRDSYVPTRILIMSVILLGGKRDEDLILPVNSSLSVTLHQDQVSVCASVAGPRFFEIS